MSLSTVVAGVDGSLVSVRALDRAAREAVRRGVPLRVMYAVPDHDAAEPVLASAVSRVHRRHPGLPVTTLAVETSAVEALASASTDAALTVVGTRGLGAVAGLVRGAVSARLVAKAHGPLLVVRGDRPHDDIGDVLLALERDTDAEAAVQAMREAARRGVRLRVLRSHTRVEPAAVPRFTMAGPRDRGPGVEVENRTHRTTAAQAQTLVEATRRAAVVVAGSPRGVRPGPVVHALLRRSHCPVIVVPCG
ncbi:universal stress protein [Streptomyces coerulescens]|uniref:Universal stress protein n=1 Tax=Streptomyces coerulescens TaxID=29304 RepID=A0ABW0CEQ5_STRCD